MRLYGSVLIVLVWLILLAGCPAHLAGSNKQKIIDRPEIRATLEQVKWLSHGGWFDGQDGRQRLILRLVINNHPVAAVRDNLNRLIDEEDIILLYWQGANAAFGELPGDLLPPSLVPVHQKNYYPVLAIGLELLQFLDKDEEVLDLMVALEHEYRHYRQWLATAEADREAFRIYERFIKNKPLSPAACRKIWHGEKETLLNSCKLIAAWGYKSGISDNLCEPGPENFAVKMTNSFIKNYYQKLTECHNEWQKLAQSQ